MFTLDLVTPYVYAGPASAAAQPVPLDLLGAIAVAVVLMLTSFALQALKELTVAYCVVLRTVLKSLVLIALTVAVVLALFR